MGSMRQRTLSCGNMYVGIRNTSDAGTDGICPHFVAYPCTRTNFLFSVVEGHVWCWGLGRQGQLGLGTVENAAVPKLVEKLKSVYITQVAAGKNHTLALDCKSLLVFFAFDCSLFLCNSGTRDAVHFFAAFLIDFFRSFNCYFFFVSLQPKDECTHGVTTFTGSVAKERRQMKRQRQ